ncbi:MAG: Gfo/Idh/MocA family protein [Candidatus Binataceae bacterium]
MSRDTALISPGQTVRLGVLGAARIAPKALIAPARGLGGVEVHAVAARELSRARAFAAAYRIPKAMGSYAELLADPAIDAVYIALPNSLHCEWTIAALQAGKHVLCEKPFASNQNEARLMAAVAHAHGMIVAEAFHYCYHPLADRVAELLAAGVIGLPCNFEASFSVPIPPPNIRYELSLAGGATMDLGCYALHMIRYFAGAEPRVVDASVTLFAPGLDIAMRARFEFANGAAARMDCSMEADARPGARLLVRGEDGALEVINPVAPHIGNVLTVTTRAGERRETVAGETSYAYQLRAFVQALRGAKSLRIDGAEAVINMGLIDEVYRAAGLAPRGTLESH